MQASRAAGRSVATALTLPGSPAGHAVRRADGERAAPALALVLAAFAVTAQVAHPLLSGTALTGATIVSVVLFTAASLAHAATSHGPGTALRVLAVAGGLGLLAEAVGVATGFPFGTYRYSSGLGPHLLGVPLLVPLAWTMMAYPGLLLGRRLATARPARIALAAWTLTSWDLFLDPQMVAAGHWSWAYPEPSLPGIPGIPLTNYAGWVLVSTVMSAALDAVVPDSTGGQAAPAVLLGWTWLGSALGNLAFFGRPAVALWGGAAMGLTVLPYLMRVLRQTRAQEHGSQHRSSPARSGQERSGQERSGDP